MRRLQSFGGGTAGTAVGCAAMATSLPAGFAGAVREVGISGSGAFGGAAQHSLSSRLARDDQR